jgi:hypothetical protein
MIALVPYYSTVILEDNIALREAWLYITYLTMFIIQLTRVINLFVSLYLKAVVITGDRAAKLDQYGF